MQKLGSLRRGFIWNKEGCRAFCLPIGQRRLLGMESMDHHTARAVLDWQIELGADEATCDAPVDRYGLQAAAPKAKTATPEVPVPAEAVDPVAIAQAAAGAAGDLDALRVALAGFAHCDLKSGAKSLVFADGDPASRVMIVGEAPGRDEDRDGLPFVGPAGQLLDKMLAAIEIERATGVYITNVLPWRPPQNRDPKPEELAMLRPFVERHIELACPDVLVLMGNISCQALLGKRGITRLRGQWVDALGKPVLPMYHPAYLLRNPAAKREAWADLLSLKARLRDG